MRDPGVLVLGMHRSGTSAVARLLDGLGLDAGPVEGLIGPTDHNPHGHFEVQALVDFNDRLLAELGGTWVAPPTHEPDRQRELAGGGVLPDGIDHIVHPELPRDRQQALPPLRQR